MRGWSTQVGERKNKQNSKEKVKTYGGRIIQPDSLYGSFPMKGRRIVKIVEISTEVKWHLGKMNVNKQIQLLILSRLARSARYIGKRVLSCSMQNRLAAANARAQPLGRSTYVAFSRIGIEIPSENYNKLKISIRSACLSKLNTTSHVMIAASRQSLPVVFVFERICTCEIQSKGRK